MEGLLFCFNKDGKILWEHSLTEDIRHCVSGDTEWQPLRTSLVVDGDPLRIIAGMANAAWGYFGMGRNRFIAFNKKTGEVVWWAYTGYRHQGHVLLAIACRRGTAPDSAASRLVIMQSTAATGGDTCVQGAPANAKHRSNCISDWGSRQLLAGMSFPATSSTSATAFEPTDDSPRPRRSAAHCLLRETAGVDCPEKGQRFSRTQIVWKKDGIKVKFASPILDKDRLYVCNETAELYCLDAKDGKQLWKMQYGKNAKGSPLLADLCRQQDLRRCRRRRRVSDNEA